MSLFFYQWVVILFAVLMVAAAIEDFLGTRIPNRLSLALLALFPVFVLLSPAPVDWIVALMLAAGVFAAGAGLYALNILGGGDVKLLSALALWAGPTLFVPVIMVTLLAGGVLSLMAMVIPGLARGPMPAGLADLADLAGDRVGSRSGTRPRPFRAGKRFSKLTVPYGIAIAAGGLYAAAFLFWQSLA